MTRTLRHVKASDIITEAQFQQWVFDVAERFGWHVIHHHGRITTRGKGWPDLVLMKAPDRVIFAELKATGGRVDPSQQWVLGVLEAAGNETRIWYPVDRPEIERELAS